MSIKIKSKKQLKREQVIPFSGEENFIVPRKGGYGMSDNEDYITVARPNYSDDSYSNLLRVTDELGDDLKGGGTSSSGGGSNSGGGIGTELKIATEDGSGSSSGKGSAVVDYAPRGAEGALPILGGGGGMGGSGTVRVDYAPHGDTGKLPVYSKPSALYSEPPTWRAATTCKELNDYKNYLEGYLLNNQNLSPADMDKYNSEMQSIVSAIPSACAVVVPDKPIDIGVRDYPSGGGDILPPPPDRRAVDSLEVLPTFPDWNSLDCSTLEQKIKEIDGKMAVETFTPLVASTYNTALANAKSVYISKGCDVKPTPTPIDYAPKGADVTPTKETPTTPTTGTTFTPTFGGENFGASPSGGGGGGEQVEEPKKKNYSWLWLLLIAGGIYIATRKKKAA